MNSLIDLAGAYLASRPEWTLDGTTCIARDGSSSRAEEHTPFRWVDLAWQTEIGIRRSTDRETAPAVMVTVRITPDTLRRWKEVAIDPLIEACAQLQDHWRSVRAGTPSTLTLL